MGQMLGGLAQYNCRAIDTVGGGGLGCSYGALPSPQSLPIPHRGFGGNYGALFPPQEPTSPPYGVLG